MNLTLFIDGIQRRVTPIEIYGCVPFEKNNLLLRAIEQMKTRYSELINEGEEWEIFIDVKSKMQ